MKRILIALAVIASMQFADAQVKTPEAAKKAVASAEAASQNPKKATKVATWIKLADAYMDAYNAPAGNAWVGATAAELQLLMGNEQPESEEQTTLAGEPVVKLVYANKDMYFNAQGQLVLIDVTHPAVENALAKALEAYVKAAEVDVKQAKTDDIKQGIKIISQKYISEGMNSYQFGDYSEASHLFGLAASASETAPLSEPDTTALYNAGFTAWWVKDYPRAQEYFEKCLAIGYYYDDGEVYAKLADIYKNQGDAKKGAELLEKGFMEFPQSQSILIGLINYYIDNNEDPDKLFYLIGKAKENEPNNASLYYVEGNIYKELGNVEKAVESYYKCSDINPEYSFGFIGAGVLYYELAVSLSEQASNEFDDAKYQVLVEQFEEALHNAIEPFEKAYEMTTDPELKKNIAEYLKNIYYRFISKGEEYKAGYDKYDAVVKGN